MNKYYILVGGQGLILVAVCAATAGADCPPCSPCQGNHLHAAISCEAVQVFTVRVGIINEHLLRSERSISNAVIKPPSDLSIPPFGQCATLSLVNGLLSYSYCSKPL